MFRYAQERLPVPINMCNCDAEIWATVKHPVIPFLYPCLPSVLKAHCKPTCGEVRPLNTGWQQALAGSVGDRLFICEEKLLEGFERLDGFERVGVESLYELLSVFFDFKLYRSF
jgi:hypothetical protein